MGAPRLQQDLVQLHLLHRLGGSQLQGPRQQRLRGRPRHLHPGHLLSRHCPALLSVDSHHLAPQHPAGRPRYHRQRPHDQGRLLDLPQQVHGHQELPGDHLLHCAGSVHCNLRVADKTLINLNSKG